MYQIKTYNEIAEAGLSLFDRDSYTLNQEEVAAHGILLRSYPLSEKEFGENLLTIARAGAGVNNIPVAAATKKGVVVFNTPGANANAVKELVLAGLLMSSRKIVESITSLKALEDKTDIAKQAEKLKARFAGPEVAGKTLGIIGLGAIGTQVAQVAPHFGIKVLGYDPFISIETALGLPREIQIEKNLTDVLAKSDYITLHIPVTEKTKAMINFDRIAKMKKGIRILNFSRPEIVHIPDILEGLSAGKIAYYVSDFADERLLDIENCLIFPHLGASTYEAENNCAIMACEQIKHYLGMGVIRNSVNFPEMNMEKNDKIRLCMIHENIPKMISHISDTIGSKGTNIHDMINKSKGEFAYTAIDLDSQPDLSVLKKISEIKGMIRLRVLD